MQANHLSRRNFLKLSGLAAGLAVFPKYLRAGQNKYEKPNILWLVSEDTSPFLGCYGDKEADTPNLDKLATQGVLYENAFANAPVCAPARFTIITGTYACSAGTQHMRSIYPIPEFVKFFPQLLRNAGYYCTNNAKQDYNTSKPPGTWDESSRNAHYKNRKPGQPFFAVFNYGDSHEHVMFKDQGWLNHSPENMVVVPYHPDLPEIRRDRAEYYDGIQKIDKKVGIALKELKDRGLAEDTIVFYYGDHGGVLARSKRYLFDSGTRAPLIIRFPHKYNRLAPARPGSRIETPVSFVDLAPTILSLAGLDIPEYIQGKAFLGNKASGPREYVYLFRGRMDERYDMIRAVRGKRYLYIRNYMPHRIYGQHLQYLWRAQSTRAWEKAYKDGNCNRIQSRFWQTKPPEELYDTQKDHHKINNLAEKTECKKILEKMRNANIEHIIKIHDVGFIPEGEMLRLAKKNRCTPYEMVRRRNFTMERIVITAELATLKDENKLDEIINRMKDTDSAVRYWAATGCAVLAKKAKPAAAVLETLLNDESADVRIAAAEALCRMEMTQAALPVIERALSHKNDKVALHAVNVLQALTEKLRPSTQSIRKAQKRGGYITRASDYLLKTLEK